MILSEVLVYYSNYSFSVLRYSGKKLTGNRFENSEKSVSRLLIGSFIQHCRHIFCIAFQSICP